MTWLNVAEGGEYSYAYLLATESAASLDILQSRAAKGCYSCNCIRSKLLESERFVDSMDEEFCSRNVSMWAEICWKPWPSETHPHFLNHVIFHRLAWTEARECQQLTACFHVETFDGEISLTHLIIQPN